MVQLAEGETLYKTFPVLNTIECTILPDEKLKCRIIGRDIKGGPLPDDFFDDVFSVEGDISVLSGGDKRVWVKPLPVGETCAIVARKRGKGEYPEGTDLTVFCGPTAFPFEKDIPEEWWDKLTQWQPLAEGILDYQKGDIVGRGSVRNRQLLLDQKGDIVGRGSGRNRQLLGQSISDRVNNSYEVLGHPQSREKPVEERTHYTVLAYSDWADSLIPTIVQWNHGEVDDFTDLDKSRENQKKALHPDLKPEGPWSYPDIWEKAKELYPDSPMDAWRYYWEESKKRLAE